MRRIIQFGTSRFLQAHADLFVHQARQAGQDIGPIAVVKTTQGGDRAGRIPALKSGRPYPVRIRGIEGGKTIDGTIEVASIDRAYEADTEWLAVVRCFAEEAEIAISNVAERGYELLPGDAAHDYTGTKAPPSFPAKVLALLLARHRAGGKPLLFLPTELISNNGRVLSSILQDLAQKTGQSTAFRDWVAQAITFPDTLVDRIVAQPIEPIGAVAEPYALWAIRKGAFQFLEHRDVKLVDDLEPYARLKLHILNLGHTVLADGWMQRGAPADEVVKQVIDGTEDAKRLIEIYWNEVLPGFQRRGMGDEAQRYVATTLERFRNPFLEHRLADIAQNHAVKKSNRIAAFIAWVREKDPDFAAPRLSAVLQS
jgi:tagaturonate reductase